MTEVIVIGAGGHAAEIDEYIKYNQKIRDSKEFVVKGFLDDNPDSYRKYRFSSPLLGSVKDHNVIQGHHYIIAIAGLYSRKAIVDRYIKEGAVFSTVIHKSAYISESAIVEEGSIIGPNVNLGPNVRVGRFSLVNARCSLGHDTIIGNYNFMSPNVCLSGFTQIGSGNLFGINSATIPGIRVGDRNKVAAGMILDQNIGDDTVVFYRYKEKIIAVPKA